MSETREFANNFPDWNPDLESEFTSIQSNAQDAGLKLLEELEYRRSEMDPRDSSVYTGMSGIALLYYHFHCKLSEKKGNSYLKNALETLEFSLKHLKHHRVSFLCGAPGPLTIAAVVYKELNMEDKMNYMLKRLDECLPLVLSETDKDLPDELLYGRVGFLYSYLYLKSKGVPVSNEIIIQIVQRILSSGIQLAKAERHKCPLMYKWHDKHYIGAAHGITGILTMLMKAQDYMKQSDLHQLIKPTVDFILSLQFPSGNFPSSLGNNSDKLMHWCHGAPGVIHMLLTAFQVFDEEKYLLSAKAACDDIWKRGLLRKGFGICHGVSGNAYGFLHMYQITSDTKYLYRALKFAEWCMKMDRKKCRTPDRPYSLFEGLAGTIYFLIDLKDPMTATFPGFQL